MKTERRDEHTSAAPLTLVEEGQAGSFRRVLRNRSFLLLWLAQLLSQIVFNAANYGVIAIVTAVTHSTVMVGFAIVSFTLPAVPFSLLAGVYVDHLDKRFVLWVSNALRAVSTALIVFALLWNPHTVLPIYFLTFFISLVTQFFTPAEASAIPLLVSKKDLAPALSLFNITLTIAQALGFLVLGGLITALFPPFSLSLGFIQLQVLSFDMLFVIVTFFYVICTLLILAIPKRALDQKQSDEPDLFKSLGKQTWEIIRHEVREAWSYVRSNRQLLLALLRVSFVSILLLVIGELAGPSAFPGYAFHFCAGRYWFSAWWCNHALAYAEVGQEPHHRPGQSGHCCWPGTHPARSLPLVVFGSTCPGDPLVHCWDHVFLRNCAGNGEYPRADGDAGASSRRGARARVFLPVDVV